MKRLYVVVRDDLPPGLQMAQACHAVREFTLKYPELDVGENLVVLQAKGEAQLLRLCFDNTWDNIDAVLLVFREPDLGGEYTAFAAASEARPLVSSLPLAGRGYVKPDARQT